MTTPNLPDAKAWIRIANGDMAAAGVLHNQVDDFGEPVCFHCQQAAEKYIKAVLAHSGLAVPKIHNLVRLIEMLKDCLPELVDVEADAAWLSFFAVEMRYPLSSGLAVTREHAERAIKIAEEIKAICLAYLNTGIGRQHSTDNPAPAGQADN